MNEIAHAVDLLRAGKLVAFPTETVYGLGADATNEAAVRHLFAVKGRPADHPVIVHVARVQQLHSIAIDVPPVARALAKECWPGPLTLVVRRRPDAIADAVSGGRDTVGVRIPAHPLAVELLEAFGGPVAAPSANRFGKVSPTTAEDVRADLDGDADLVLDGGACTVGVESTILDITGDEPRLLRLGGVSEARLTELMGQRIERIAGGGVAAPGTLASHYAPNARVELVHPDDVSSHLEALRSSGIRAGVLELPDDHTECARVLYSRLRAADADGYDVVLAVAPGDDDGIGAVVRDRLRRAAAR
jgi:L-threonylcarbamoyladenylate synthase